MVRMPSMMLLKDVHEHTSAEEQDVTKKDSQRRHCYSLRLMPTFVQKTATQPNLLRLE